MQPVDELDCIARAAVLNDAADYLAHRSSERREMIAAEWVQVYLRRSANMWLEKAVFKSL